MVGVNCLVEDFIPNPRATTKMKLFVSIVVLCFAFTSALHADNMDDIVNENKLDVFSEEGEDESTNYEAPLEESSDEIDDQSSQFLLTPDQGLLEIRNVYINIFFIYIINIIS